MLDLYVGALWWCKQQSYNADQTSAFFTVIDTLLNNIGEVYHDKNAVIIESSYMHVSGWSSIYKVGKCEWYSE